MFRSQLKDNPGKISTMSSAISSEVVPDLPPETADLHNTLLAVLVCWNADRPRQRMTAVTGALSMQNWTASVVPKSQSVLFKTGDGVIRECKITALVSALETFCPESPSDQLPGWETMKQVIETASLAQERCLEMGLDVLYRSVVYDIKDDKPVDVEKRFYESYPVDQKTIQVFRTRNGEKYAYVILMGKTAFVQIPDGPFSGIEEMVNAVLISAYNKGNRECAVCMEETRDILVGFACVMHSICRECHQKLPETKCPICRSGEFHSSTHMYMPRCIVKM